MEEEVDIMIFKDDDGYWKFISTADIGIPTGGYETYEDLVFNLPEHIRMLL